MITQETIQSWRWRIKRVGISYGEFAKIAGITPEALSSYMSQKLGMSLKRLDHIESKLRELENNND